MSNPNFGRPWSDYEKSTLRVLWPSASRAELERAIPGRSWGSMSEMAWKIDAPSRRRKTDLDRTRNRRTESPIIRKLIDRRMDLKMTCEDVAARAGYTASAIARAETHGTAGRFMLRDWAAALGMEVVLDVRMKGAKPVAAVAAPLPSRPPPMRVSLVPRPNVAERFLREFDPAMRRVVFTDPDMDRLELVRITPRQLLDMLGVGRKAAA